MEESVQRCSNTRGTDDGGTVSPFLSSSSVSEGATPLRNTKSLSLKSYSPSTKGSKAVTQQSQGDYSCYTIHGAGSLLAVIIEAKINRGVRNVVAQVWPHP